MSDNYALILAGGKGTRFWPKSRMARPKQFLSLNSSRSLIQLTYDRVTETIPRENVFIVTAQSQVHLIREHLPLIPEDQIIVEPMGRNTCPAIALGTAYIRQRNPRATILVIPSDQLVRDESSFSKATEVSMEYARTHSCIVLFGIRPISPHTGYGYIATGSPLGESFRTIQAFVEKPDRVTAESYIRKRNYYWNSGMFIFPVNVFFDELDRSLPMMSRQIEDISRAIGSSDEARTISEVYPQTQEISIDYGIMEKSAKTVLYPLDVGWSDVGSWSSLYDVLQTDDEGNYFENRDSVAVNSQKVIGLTSKMVAAVGVDDLILVETHDAILVCRKDSAQDIRLVLDELKRRGRTEYL